MRFSLPLIALAAVASPLSATNAPVDAIVTVRVSYADVDLTTEAGRAAVAARVEAEVRKACTIETNSRFGYGRDIVDETCVAEARAEALAKVERVAAREARGGADVAAN